MLACANKDTWGDCTPLSTQCHGQDGPLALLLLCSGDYFLFSVLCTHSISHILGPSPFGVHKRMVLYLPRKAGSAGFFCKSPDSISAPSQLFNAAIVA